jgi:RNA polymerase sigma-70 factor (ECF subfamily)
MSDKQDLDFAMLVREHQAGLRAFIRSLGADDAWVDDLAQEAFLVTYQKQATFDQSADFGKWLRGIARKQVMAECRKKARRGRLMHDGITEILLNLGQGEDEIQPDRAKLVAAMKSCVGKLSDSQRNLLHARYEKGRKAKDMAGELEQSADAIRKQLQRIRRSVRHCIEKKLGDISL